MFVVEGIYVKNKKGHTGNLIYQVSQDNRQAYNRFYELYYDQVYRFAYYFLKDQEACIEVVTEVFVAVWKSRKKLQQITNMETYLFIAVRNEAGRYLKQTAKHNHISLQDIPICIENNDSDSPEDQILYEDMEKFLMQAIRELPEKCRLIFLLARQEGLKSKEIAEQLNINESTVRVQMKIAIEKLIQSLKPHFPDITFSLLLLLLFH